jgi:hypothetical protein
MIEHRPWLPKLPRFVNRRPRYLRDLLVTHKYGNVATVKTTIELPDDLFRRAKVTAASGGMSLKELFTQAVEERLRRDGMRPVEPAWKALAGNLAPLRKETRRIEARIDDEFGQVDEDDE